MCGTVLARCCRLRETPPPPLSVFSPPWSWKPAAPSCPSPSFPERYEKNTTQSMPACHFTNTHTHTHRPVKRCTAKPSHTHKLRVYIEMQRVQINRLPSVYPCFPQCLSCGHVYVSVRVSFPRCVLSPSSDSVQIIILRSLKVVFTCCLVQIHTYTLSSFNINGLDFL